MLSVELEIVGYDSVGVFGNYLKLCKLTNQGENQPVYLDWLAVCTLAAPRFDPFEHSQ